LITTLKSAKNKIFRC